MSARQTPCRLWLGYTILVVALLLVVGLIANDAQALPVNTYSSSPGVQGPLTPRAWLPLVMKSPQFMKARSGIHLGNRSEDWSATLLQRLEFKTDGSGVWPAAVVVLSDQIYDIPRDPSTCHVKWWEKAGIKRTNVFNYLKRATQAGTKVIIRLYPSPGNFLDYNVSGWPYHYLWTDGPAGPRYLCNHELYTQNEIGRFATYRSPDDLVAEMASIHRANQAAGWAEYGFEPANEPNLEWYYPPGFTWGIPLYDPDTWKKMDDYFAAAYDYYTTWASYLGDFRLLAPPMDQDWYAIELDLADCTERKLTDRSIGYDHMEKTYRYKFDGYDWHNYWMYGHEQYLPCGQGGNLVSYYFPGWMKDAIWQRGGNISEADLASPEQMQRRNPLTSKAGTDAYAAVDSLKQFVVNEPNATRVVIWLLNDNTGNAEHDWHEAYSDYGYEWNWFNWWWLNQENSP